MYLTRLLIVLLLVSLCGAQSMKVTLGPIREEQKTASYVGNIASATSISRELTPMEFNTLRFDFLDPTDKWANLFSINGRSGALFTQTMIDREELCEDRHECLIKFDVTVYSDVTDFLRLVEVTINITDVNDNSPVFPSDQVWLDIPENNAVGLTKPLPSAVDKDKGENSVQKYALVGALELFSLNVERRLNNRFHLSLVVNAALDRERKDRYSFLLVAMDGGATPLTGTLTVHVNVTDTNDNSPVFSQQEYSYSVVETAGVGEVLGRLSATDRDLGKNADIRYSLSFAAENSRGRDLFGIDQFTGEITIKAPLQFDAGLTLEAVVEARDQGEVPRLTEATMSLTIVNVGNNAPQLDLRLQKTVLENTVHMAEDAKNGTFVGKLTAVDNDPGASGIVTCSSAHPSFRTDNFGGYYAVILSGSLDRERAEKVEVRLVCQDAGSPPKTSSTSFHVIVTDVNDNAPVFSQTQYVVNISEENMVGKPILKLTAEDPDAGVNKMFTYSLFPKENTVFSIDKNSGILKARTTFDHEVEKRLNVIILAADEGHPSLVSTATVIVNILDINDNYPEVVTKELRVPEGGANRKLVGQVEGSDKDSGLNAELVFSMPPSDSRASQVFKLSPSGMLETLQELDRESQGSYELKLEVRDRGQEPKLTSATVTVLVEDINDNAPVFKFPTQKNHTVGIQWSTPTSREIARVMATDDDLGQNRTVSYYIYSGNKADLFGLHRTSGVLFLQRKVRHSDSQFLKLIISAQDGGVPPLESHAFLDVVVDMTNASFAALDQRSAEDKYILLAGCIAGVTLLFSVLVLLVIFFIRRSGRGRPTSPGGKHTQWQVVKTGIQEECGKGEVEKVVSWSGSDVDVKDVENSEDEEVGDSSFDQTKMDHYSSSKERQVGSNGKDAVLPEVSPSMDTYQKQEFYTFCKVRAHPHDDVNSITSGETTTSDSGRGGSEDDIPLPPIAECSPEMYSNHASPKQEVEYRPMMSEPGTLNRPLVKTDFRTLPSLSSFRSSDIKLYPVKSCYQPASPKDGQHPPHTHLNSQHPSNTTNVLVGQNQRWDTIHRSTMLGQTPSHNRGLAPSRHVSFTHTSQSPTPQKSSGDFHPASRSDPNWSTLGEGYARSTARSRKSELEKGNKSIISA